MDDGKHEKNERILRMAEAEDACESVSVGGLAVDVGFPVENENTYPADALRAAYRHGARDALDRVLAFCHQMNWLDPNDKDSWYLKGWRAAEKRVEEVRVDYE